MARVNIEFPEKKILCSYETTVRLSDLSPARHLGFDRLVSIINDASLEFIKSTGMDTSGKQVVREIFADLAVQYISEAFRGDRLKIDIAVGEISSKGFEILFKVFNLNRSSSVVALAKIGCVFFDYEKRCTAEIPVDVRRNIQ